MTAAGDRDPGLVIRDGVPVSTRFDDVYFSREGGLAETAHVFLEGAGLPDAWANRRRFTIGETGFGTGLNFLAAWDLWRRTRPPGGLLHYFAVEGYPIRRGTLATVLTPFRPVAPLADRLIARYPAPAPGVHRIWFPEDGVCLTLAIGEAAAVMPRLEASVDAWFLDGFAPARNPTMWEPAVLEQVARLSAPGARLATFTAAGAVRRGLELCGFAMARRPGFGTKRECLAGTFRGTASAGRAPSRVAVVGAGIAGASLAGALARRGIETVWLDRRTSMAAEASGNPVGVLMPRPTLEPTPAGDLSAAAFAHVLAECAERGVPVGGDGVLELAGDEATQTRQQRLSEAGMLDPVDGRVVDAVETSRIAGVALDRPAVWYRRAGWVSPPALVETLAGPAGPMTVREIAAMWRVGEAWRFCDRDGSIPTEVDAVILAAGAASQAFPQLSAVPIRPVRGQLSFLPPTALSERLRAVLTFGGYIAPAVNGCHVAGATYDRADLDPDAWPQPVTARDHDRVRAGLPGSIAGWFDGVVPLGGRAALRAVTPDRLPVAGPLPDIGLHVLTGLGSRGLVTAPLLAELVVARMLGEPWPVERAVADAVDPGRFELRARRRRQG